MGIREFQALAYLLQPDTAATLVVSRFWEVAVGAGEGDFPVILHVQTDVYE